MTELNHQQELLAAIGQKLRAAREGQGISLQDVAARTRIQAVFLDKIEQGDLEGLPAISFTRGFIRNYAQMLGLDEPELQEQLRQLGQAVEAAPVPPMKPLTERLLDAEKVAAIPWPQIALLGLLAILVLWVGYLLVRVFLPSDTAYEPPAKAPAVQTSPVPAPAAGRPAVSSVAPAPILPLSPAQPTATNAGAGAPAAGLPAVRPGMGPNALRVRIQGLEDTWVRYSVDRKPALEVLMRPAETATLDAEDEVRLTIGRSRGVSVYLNGEEVPLPAQRNLLVADLVLNKLTLVKMRN
ncbi:MAG: RodZ domain-containing protein [SAR324 cluster bacterium]